MREVFCVFAGKATASLHHNSNGLIIVSNAAQAELMRAVLSSEKMLAVDTGINTLSVWQM